MTSEKSQINQQLALLGLRTAHPNESGWYVTVYVDQERRKVWATSKQKEPT